MRLTTEQFPEVEIVEYTVAPQVNPDEGLPRHEWYVAFVKPPHDIVAFEQTLDAHLVNINSYYEDLIVGSILSPLKVMTLPPDAFRDYMKSQGKLGGQNKVPRLSINDRKIADVLSPYVQQ